MKTTIVRDVNGDPRITITEEDDGHIVLTLEGQCLRFKRSRYAEMIRASDALVPGGEGLNMLDYCEKVTPFGKDF